MLARTAFCGQCVMATAWLDSGVCDDRSTVLHGLRSNSIGVCDGEAKPKLAVVRDADSEFVGVVLLGQKHGRGKITYAGGDTLSGSWTNGKLHGVVVFQFANGDTAHGEYCENVPTGQVTVLLVHHGIQHTFFEIKGPRAPLLRQQTALQPVGQLGHDRIHLLRLLIQITAQPHQLVGFAQILGADFLVIFSCKRTIRPGTRAAILYIDARGVARCIGRAVRAHLLGLAVYTEGHTIRALA